MSDLEKEIIGAYLMNKTLFEEISCNAEDFESPYCKLILKKLKTAYKKGRETDIAILAVDLDKKVPASYISSLLDGFPKSQATVEVVKEKIRRLKNKRIGGKIIQESGKQGEFILKGIPPDLTETRELLKKYDIINKSKEQL